MKSPTYLAGHVMLVGVAGQVVVHGLVLPVLDHRPSADRRACQERAGDSSGNQGAGHGEGGGRMAPCYLSVR